MWFGWSMPRQKQTGRHTVNYGQVPRQYAEWILLSETSNTKESVLVSREQLTVTGYIYKSWFARVSRKFRSISQLSLWKCFLYILSLSVYKLYIQNDLDGYVESKLLFCKICKSCCFSRNLLMCCYTDSWTMNICWYWIINILSCNIFIWC